MDDQKMENLLNLALSTPESVRERTVDLNVGYESGTKSWELIVKYNGDLSGLREAGILVEELIAGYAVLTVPEELVESVVRLPQIEYAEKPKRLWFEAADGRATSCIPSVTAGESYLSGEGVLLAVIDSGIEYTNRAFRKRDGSTKILALWDQTVTPDKARGFFSPEGFQTGTEFDRERINAALAAPSDAERLALLPTRDVSGHGTAVAGIAADIAKESDLLIVKLGTPKKDSFPRTTELMKAVTYAVRTAQSRNRPVVINLSFGNTYGAHDGSSLLERFMDNAAEIGRTTICVGSGNEGAGFGHCAGRIRTGQSAEAELAVAEYERALSVQLWKNFSDVFEIRLRTPEGREAEVTASVERGKYTVRLGQTEVLVYVGEPSPYSAAQEIYFELLPVERPYLTGGIWSFRLTARRAVSGQYDFYLPSAAARNAGTVFFRPSPQRTYTIPSTAYRVITVGACDSTYDSYADFSGRGTEVEGWEAGAPAGNRVKPDLVAPGVGILAPDIYGGYMAVTGTSFATPIVSGSAALLTEWGIVRGNDPYLYGEKMKAYLRMGAQPLRGIENYPDSRVGWGKLCVEKSLRR